MAKKLYMPLTTLSIRPRPEGFILLHQWSRFFFFFIKVKKAFKSRQLCKIHLPPDAHIFPTGYEWTAESEYLHNHSRYWISPAPTPSTRPPFQPEVTYYPVAKSGKTLSGKGGRGGCSEKCFLDPVSAWSENKGWGAGATLPPFTTWLVLYHE